MFIQIDPSNGLAIYEQVVRQVKYAVAAGAVRAGEMVPSVREMAKALAINPNTVTRAYRELQNAGVLQTVRGTGLEVTQRAVEQCRQERVELIRQRLRLVLVEAQQSGLGRGQLRKLIDEELRLIQHEGESAS